MNVRRGAASGESPLPRVSTGAVEAVLEKYAGEVTGGLVQVDLEEAFLFLFDNNFEIVEAVGGTLRDAGYRSPERVGAKAVMTLTHALMHAEVRIGRGLPGIGPPSDAYLLPVVTPDTARSYFIGEAAREQVLGESLFEEFNSRNPWIVSAIRIGLGLNIGQGPEGGRELYAAEFAAIATHGLLEQAAVETSWSGQQPG